MPDKIFLDNAFFGRETELKKIIFNALVGKNTLIIGKKGIGKTSLLEQAINIITGTTHKIEFSPTVLEKTLTMSEFPNACVKRGKEK
jgi:MoxR-like ATPase